MNIYKENIIDTFYMTFKQQNDEDNKDDDPSIGYRHFVYVRMDILDKLMEFFPVLKSMMSDRYSDHKTKEKEITIAKTFVLLSDLGQLFSFIIKISENNDNIDTMYQEFFDI